MRVGDIVKSMDFNGIDDCYMVGVVVAVQFDGLFRAKFVKRVWQGVEDRKFKTDFFTAPLQGQHMFDNDAMPRVSVVA
jgi:hypothetical protein